MKTVKTPKGTDLPLLCLQGKDYLQVQHRLIWFREDHPDWTIETEAVKIDDIGAIFRATIKDETGRVIAMAHKSETYNGFADAIEKSETGSIGRALALVGYGTQFTTELDEGTRIVDAPVGTASSGSQIKTSSDPKGNLENDPFKWAFPSKKGKFAGKRIEDVTADDLDGLAEFLQRPDTKCGWKNEFFDIYNQVKTIKARHAPDFNEEDIPYGTGP